MSDLDKVGNRSSRELEKWSDRLRSVGATPERVWAQLRSIVSGNHDLSMVAPERLAALAVQIYLLGLDLDPQLGQVWIRPSGKRGEASIMIGYRGWIALSGVPVHCQLVYQGDDFRARFSSDGGLQVEHEIGPGGSEVVAAYASVTIDGERRVHVIPQARIKKAIEEGGRTWKTHPESMIRAMAIRELFKTIPASPKLTAALKVDDMTSTQVEPLNMPPTIGTY